MGKVAFADGQAVPQLMPDGMVVTVPDPTLLTVSEYNPGPTLSTSADKLLAGFGSTMEPGAVTVIAWLMVLLPEPVAVVVIT